MSNLPEKLKSNLAFIVEQAGQVDMFASTAQTDSTATSQLDLALSELSLIALMTADALEGTRDRTDFLMYNELARRLRKSHFCAWMRRKWTMRNSAKHCSMRLESRPRPLRS